MASLRQFNKGETINITVTPDDGVDMPNPVLYVYPDLLDLSNSPDVDKIQKLTNPTTGDGDSKVFSISPSTTGGANMPTGDYTVELKYGSSDTDVSIVKQNHAFTLVESGTNIKN